MSNARENILARLRKAAENPLRHPNPTREREAEWQARQAPLGDLATRFTVEQERLGGKVVRVPDWKSMPEALDPWFREFRVGSAMTGTDDRLNPLRAYLEETLGIGMHTYSAPIEEQKEEVFSVDCGITTAYGGVADTGSVILVPSAKEPRLLSLAPPIHLAIVEVERIFPTLGAFLKRGDFQNHTPSNLVFVTGPSRTADIELTLTVGVHGPKVTLVALVG
ncbi:MAG: LUD domain-containing protein [SAR324 cluster bacterium]|nr:LUD domain-containing protein [SAR324 cluster bacterium]